MLRRIFFCHIFSIKSFFGDSVPVLGTVDMLKTNIAMFRFRCLNRDKYYINSLIVHSSSNHYLQILKPALILFFYLDSVNFLPLKKRLFLCFPIHTIFCSHSNCANTEKIPNSWPSLLLVFFFLFKRKKKSWQKIMGNFIFYVRTFICPVERKIKTKEGNRFSAPRENTFKWKLHY